MITNKERLGILIEQIKRLEALTEEMREQDIYPVSFFSQAFDIANKIQEDLQQIEISQIELIESQVKKQQEPQLFTQQEMIAPAIVPPPVNYVQETVAPMIAPPPVQQVQDEKKVISAYSSGGTTGIDLKKMLTLNDRFLFCRELFSNNENLMNLTFNELNMEESYEAAIEYLQKRFEWNFEDKNVTDFLAVLNKKFS